MNKNILSLVVFLGFYSAQAGVHVVVDLEEASEVVEENQQALESAVESINDQQGTKYRWQNAQFLTHASLCFVNQNERSAQQTQTDFPRIGEVLEEVGPENDSFTIAIDGNTKIEWFDGKFEVMCGNSKKKNYKTAVLALDNPALTKLATHVANKMKDKYNIIQRFPFSGHITLGRVYEENDQPLTSELQQALNDFKPVITKAIAIKISEFKLKGHDGSERVFKLSAK